jgi:cobalamin biosynthesis protein CobT
VTGSWTGAQSTTNIIAFHIREIDVEQGKVGGCLTANLKRLLSTQGRVDFIPLRGEVDFQQARDVWLVLNDEDAFFAHGDFSSRSGGYNR